MPDGQVSVALSHEVTLWHSRLTPERQAVVDERLRQLARNPERSLVTRERGREVRTAVIVIKDGEVWGYRVKFVVDEVMRRHLPAIKVLAVRQVPYPAQRR